MILIESNLIFINHAIKTTMIPQQARGAYEARAKQKFPTAVLGWKFSTWTRPCLRAVLQYFNQENNPMDSKEALMTRLEQVLRHREEGFPELTAEYRDQILSAARMGHPRPYDRVLIDLAKYQSTPATNRDLADFPDLHKMSHAEPTLTTPELQAQMDAVKRDYNRYLQVCRSDQVNDCEADDDFAKTLKKIPRSGPTSYGTEARDYFIWRTLQDMSLNNPQESTSNADRDQSSHNSSIGTDITRRRTRSLGVDFFGEVSSDIDRLSNASDDTASSDEQESVIRKNITNAPSIIDLSDYGDDTYEEENLQEKECKKKDDTKHGGLLGTEAKASSKQISLTKSLASLSQHH